MQDKVLAYKEKRWPEAEVAFQAPLKAAEYFGPQNPLLAITLYYLASAQAMQDRHIEAEPLLRRALDIFDAQSKIDDLEVARLHRLTLDDLAAIYAVRARSAAPPSTKQGYLEEAERLFQRALAMREKSDPG